ncbi:head maturation protease, ClpP-related [Stenotrophomonas terrae]|uniref:head maturation protease, ClpP-related n=1 Tax=Stenotrophomonas terrae TaxID=405446 RepID=UPI00071038F1|nr:head maturation protease, ClpP-related [Stenotrophomonas terrae]
MSLRKLPEIRADAGLAGMQFDIREDAIEAWQPEMQAAASDPATSISIYGRIGQSFDGTGVTSRIIAAALRSIGPRAVTVNINSPGGDYFEGLGIYNLLRQHAGEVTVHVLSMAASAASVIAMAGDRILMADHSRIMIHNAWGVAVGTGAAVVGVILDDPGAVQETLLAFYRRTVSPEQFGAKGDGITDDTVAMQKALDRAAGGTLVLTQGRIYRQTAALFFHADTVILGNGATLLRGADIDNMLRNRQTGAVEWYSTQKVSITGLKFDANFPNYAAVSSTSLAFAHASYVTIRDCEFTETPTFHQIEINSSRHVTVDNCRFIGGNGQNLQGNESIQLDYSYAGGYPWEGPYDNTACLNIRVVNCVFDGTGTAIGSHSHAAGVVHTAILVEGCQMFSPFYAGIRLENWSNVTVRGCRFTGGALGIIAWAFDAMVMSDYIIEGNLFSNHGNSGYAYNDCRAVRFLGQADGSAYFQRILVANNTVRDLTATGTRTATHALTADYCQHVKFIGNVVQNVRGSGIYTYGSSWVTIDANTLRGVNASAGANNAGVNVTAAAAGGTVRGVISNNLTDTLRLTNADRFLVRGNNVTTAGGLTNSGNTNTSVSSNLVDTVAS